ncbi:hypothetical protein AMTR_s00073p00028090 [Amborella trichopoda]|uniref:Uncharacterized protein n=1 Tax=Amborella trichopoda TaxID=13333 RepID=W1NNG0_AMBTC|nr:hypothetical protein AMTR_s00073p00028090 [Amborella trichopoda]
MGRASNYMQSLLTKALTRLDGLKVEYYCEEKAISTQIFNFTTRTRNCTAGLRLLMEDMAMSPHHHNDKWVEFVELCMEDEEWMKLTQWYEENQPHHVNFLQDWCPCGCRASDH